jgi:NADH-quinone oxidoreductase subunit I
MSASPTAQPATATPAPPAPPGPPKSAAAEPLPAPYPTTTRPYRQSVAERLYLPLVGGLLVTLRHFLRNLFHPGRMLTIEYPEERRAYSHRFRGHHILTTRPDGSVRCVACYLCAQACPAECIHIEAAEHPDVNIEKYPVVYEIDMLRCVFCGYCVDACPEEAIIMSNNYDMAYFNRDQTVVGKADLMKPFTFDEELLGYRPRYPEEEAQRAKMRREAFSIVEAARRAREGPREAPAAASAAPPAAGSPPPPAPPS